MRKEKVLINLLRGLVDLLGEEAARNAEFAARLESLLAPLPGKVPTKQATPKQISNLPDIYTERNERGSSEFRMWLSDQPIGILRALIRHHDFDATRRTSKWRDAGKLSQFIADQLESRLARGSSFLRTADDS
jgi:hypothetical protein